MMYLLIALCGMLIYTTATIEMNKEQKSKRA